MEAQDLLQGPGPGPLPSGVPPEPPDLRRVATGEAFYAASRMNEKDLESGVDEWSSNKEV